MQPQQPAPTAVVADDERLMREQIIGRLKEAWPELVIVGEASNGSEAIALVQSEEPDIVFLDISMPGMDGDDAVRQICQQHPVPFILVSAYSKPSCVPGDVHAVRWEYLTKPIQANRVLAVVRSLLKRD